MEQKLIMPQRSKNKQNRCTCKIESASTLGYLLLRVKTAQLFYQILSLAILHAALETANLRLPQTPFKEEVMY